MATPLTLTIDHASFKGSISAKNKKEVLSYGKTIIDEQSFDSDNCNFRDDSIEEKLEVKDY